MTAMPMRVRIAQTLLLAYLALYVAYRLGAPDLFGIGLIEALIHNLLRAP